IHESQKETEEVVAIAAKVGKFDSVLNMRRKDGSLFPAHLVVVPRKDSDGKIVDFYGIAEDITEQMRAEKERRSLEAQIQHAQKLESMGVLAGGIAHDFNNLLMGILGNASIALMELSLESPVTRRIQQIETTALRASELTNQMLAYSGKGAFVIQPLNLSRLVEEMSHLLETVISKKAVLKFDFADYLPLIEGDATQIRQIVMNLITNASDAIGDKSGIITITTGSIEVDRNYFFGTYLNENMEEGIYVFFEVSDTGSGMNEETKSKIFDPFFSTKFKGRGLGLAAVLGIVRGHKGAIKVYSESGRGTSFKVLFPCAKNQDINIEIEKMKKESEWSSEGTVLVVDDVETVRSVAKIILEKFGFKVLTARDGKEGVEVFEEFKDEIILVILDMTMPRLSGEEAFMEMRKIKSDVRVILSSGYKEKEATCHFAGKGLAGFIQKPYRPKDLLVVMKDVLS
ncbi:response regulator, partial [bacterium]|nr:response regulator [bacterium]